MVAEAGVERAIRRSGTPAPSPAARWRLVILALSGAALGVVLTAGARR
ncbi:MAG TPA: hypothetical protein VGK18_09025 [Propionicimonas sp.]